MATRTPKIPDAALSRVPGQALYRMASQGAEIVIGGDHPSLVLPDAWASKWGGECWLRVRHADALAMKASDRARERSENGKRVLELPVSAKKRRHEIREGSLKWDVIYEDSSALPADGIERFQLEFPAGLTWHYQPPLTAEEIAEGAERPENVVGSYAGYWSQSGRYLDRNGEEIANYETGKFAHLYRPEMADAAGNRCWAEQELVGNELRITLPAEWMASAVYPVRLDPTFGYETIGGSNVNTSGNIVRAHGPFVPSTSGSVQSHSIYASSTSLQMGMYSNSGSLPGSLLHYTDKGSFAGTAEWKTIDVLSGNFDVVAGTPYWFGFNHSGGSLYYDSTSGTSQQNQTYSLSNNPSLIDPFGTPSSQQASRRNSRYATYTESGGLAAPTLTAPANTATGVALRPNFTWS